MKLESLVFLGGVILTSLPSYAEPSNDPQVTSIRCTAATLFYGTTDIHSTPALGLSKSFAATPLSKLEYNSESDQLSPKPLFTVIIWGGKLQLNVKTSEIAKVPATASTQIILRQEVALEVGEIPETFQAKCVVR